MNADLARSASRMVVQLVLVSVMGVASPAYANFADRVCTTSSLREPTLKYPASDSLDLVTTGIEARIGVGNATAITNGMLDPTGNQLISPPAARLAAYCAAAGELMRTAAQGSQLQAQTYLLSAYNYAIAADDRRMAMISSYRLGLVWLGAPANIGSRGVGRKRGRARGSETTPAVVGAFSGCAAIGGEQTGPTLSAAALACAASLAGTEKIYRYAALADYRLAAINLARADLGTDQVAALRKAAADHAVAALASAMAMDPSTLRNQLLGRIAWTLLAMDIVDVPGIDRAASAIEFTAGADVEALAYASAIRSRLALAHGDRAKAMAAAERAIFFESQRPVPLRLSEWYLLLARISPESRRQYAMAAYRSLESIRSFLPRIDALTQEPNYPLLMRPVFEAAVDTELADSGGADDIQRIITAQEIVEASRQAELQSVFGNECIPARDPVKLTALRRNEILLYPVLLPDRIELLYADGSDSALPGGVRYKRLPVNRSVNRDTVARLATDFIVAINDGDDRWKALSRELYDQLIKPVEARLAEGSTLILVPDGPLRGLPFAALRNADGKFLVQQARLTIVPSLAYSQPGLDRTGKQPNVVAAALEREVDLPSGYFAKLEGTEEEARTAVTVADRVRGRNRMIANFKAVDLASALAADRVDILHLATHASFNGRSDRAFIVADGETIPLSALRGLISKNLTRGDELDLLVLSACETAVGDDEASMGLAGAAVQAGARSAIASLWEISDSGTVALMREFYSRYRAGQPKADALRGAQLAMISSGGDISDPYIWAAFVLLGAWR